MRAPWRWHWTRILALLAQCAGWAGALVWSPFFGIPLSLWVVMQIRAPYTEPRSPTAPEREPEPEEAGHRREEQFNGAQITYHPAATGSSNRRDVLLQRVRVVVPDHSSTLKEDDHGQDEDQDAQEGSCDCDPGPEQA